MRVAEDDTIEQRNRIKLVKRKKWKKYGKNVINK